MSDGFLFWYQRDWSRETVSDRIGDLESAGFSLAHLVNGRIAALSSDLDTIGEQVFMDRSTLVRRAALETDDSFTFQYWIDDDTDVPCGIRRVSADVVVQALYLDGLIMEQQDFVLRVVLNLVRARPNTTVGVVFDRRGGSADEDWNAVVTGVPERVRVRPYLIGLLAEVAAQHPELQSVPPIQLADLVVYDYEGVLPAST